MPFNWHPINKQDMAQVGPLRGIWTLRCIGSIALIRLVRCIQSNRRPISCKWERTYMADVGTYNSAGARRQRPTDAPKEVAAGLGLTCSPSRGSPGASP